MAKVRFEDGTIINFEGKPTPVDIEEAYMQVKGGQPKTTTPSLPIGQMLLRNLGEAGKDVYREGISPLLSGVSTFALGIPKAVAQKTGAKDIMYPEQQTLAGKTLRGISEIGGFMGGLGVKAGGAIASKIAGQALRQKVARGAIQYGVAGGLQTPTEKPLDLGQRTTQAVAGAVAGGIAPIIQAIPKLINLGGKKTAQAIAEKADKGFDKLSQGLSDKYDDVLSNMKGSYKSKVIIKDIQQTIDEFPEGANIGKLKSIIKRLKDVKDVSGKELFNIKKEIGKTIPKSVWNGISDADSITNSKEQLYWRLTEKLEQLGGDKYKGLTAEYKNFKFAERLAKKMFYRQGVPSNVPLGGTYDIPTQQAVRGLSSQLQPKEQFAQAFEAWRRGTGLKQVGKRIAPWIPAMLGLGYMGSRAFRTTGGGE